MNYTKILLCTGLMISCFSFAAEKSITVWAVIYTDTETGEEVYTTPPAAVGRGVFQRYMRSDCSVGKCMLTGFLFKNGFEEGVLPVQFSSHNGVNGSMPGSICALKKLPLHLGDKPEFITRMPLR